MTDAWVQRTCVSADAFYLRPRAVCNVSPHASPFAHLNENRTYHTASAAWNALTSNGTGSVGLGTASILAAKRLSISGAPSLRVIGYSRCMTDR